MEPFIQLFASRWLNGDKETYEAWVNPKWISCIQFRNGRAYICLGTSLDANGDGGGTYSDEVILDDAAEISRLRMFLKNELGYSEYAKGGDANV